MKLLRTLLSTVTLFTLLTASTAFAEATAVNVNFLISGLRDASGDSLSGGTIEFRVNDGSSTLKTIYEDAQKTTEASNPFTLDSRGVATIYAERGDFYRVIIKDSDSITQYDISDLQWGESSSTEVDVVADYGNTGDALQDAIDDIESSIDATLLINDSIGINANISVPDNINLKIVKGGELDIESSVVVTVLHLEAGNYQIKDGAGTLTLSSTNHPIQKDIWFGNTTGYVSNEVTFKGDVTVLGTLSVPTLNVTSTTSGNFTVSGDMAVNEALSVAGSSEFTGIITTNAGIVSLGDIDVIKNGARVTIKNLDADTADAGLQISGVTTSAYGEVIYDSGTSALQFGLQDDANYFNLNGTDGLNVKKAIKAEKGLNLGVGTGAGIGDIVHSGDLTTSGNASIGGTLSTTGNATLRSDVNMTGSALLFQKHGGGVVWNSTGVTGGANSSDIKGDVSSNLTFRTDATEAMIIDSSQDVSIPAGKLFMAESAYVADGKSFNITSDGTNAGTLRGRFSADSAGNVSIKTGALGTEGLIVRSNQDVTVPNGGLEQRTISGLSVLATSALVNRILLKNNSSSWSQNVGTGIDFECNDTTDAAARIAVGQSNSASSGGTRDYTYMAFLTNANGAQNGYAALVETLRLDGGDVTVPNGNLLASEGINVGTYSVLANPGQLKINQAADSTSYGLTVINAGSTIEAPIYLNGSALTFGDDLTVDMSSGDVSIPNGSLAVGENSNVQSVFGRARIGYDAGVASDIATFGHYDQTGTSVALYQNSAGGTVVNAATGQSVSLRTNNVAGLTMDSSQDVSIPNGGLEVSETITANKIVVTSDQEFTSWTPTLSAISGTVPDYFTVSAQYKVVSGILYFWMRLDGNGGTAGAGIQSLIVEMPEAPASTTTLICGSGRYRNGTTRDSLSVDIYDLGSGGELYFYKNTSGGYVTTGDQDNISRSIYAAGSYQIAN